MSPAPSCRIPTVVWRSGFTAQERVVAEETPIALSYNRLTHAVMMASPVDLEDFAVGFSRSEGIVASASEIEELEIITTDVGVECRMWINPMLLDRLDQRRRSLAGPTGCGLCGLESLSEAIRLPPTVGRGIMVTAADIQAAMHAMPALQLLNTETRAVHAAGFWRQDSGLTTVREDVGRHNALDKLSGALARSGQDGAGGMVVLTSRISLELVQKAAALGATIVVAVSAPTRRALEIADAVGMTLVGIARRDGFEIFTHPHRISEAKEYQT